MAQLSHIWWDYKNCTQAIIYTPCAIEPSFLHSLNGHYPYNSIYPHPCWDDSTYSYPSQIRKGINVCDHSVIYRKFNSVEWMSEEQKNVSCKNKNLQWFVQLAYAWDVFWCAIVLVDQIAHGEYDCKTVILTMIFYRSLVSESAVTGLGVHTWWWMYAIILNSLCYLARVRPVCLSTRWRRRRSGGGAQVGGKWLCYGWDTLNWFISWYLKASVNSMCVIPQDLVSQFGEECPLTGEKYIEIILDWKNCEEKYIRRSIMVTLHEHYFSNRKRLDCLFNSFFSLTSKKPSDQQNSDRNIQIPNKFR